MLTPPGRTQARLVYLYLDLSGEDIIPYLPRRVTKGASASPIARKSSVCTKPP